MATRVPAAVIMAGMSDVQALQFRAATTSDVPAIVALVESAYRGEASRAGWTTEADILDGQRIDPEGVAEVIARPDSRVLLAERDGDAAGLRAHRETRRRTAISACSRWSPGLQNGGIGKRVLAEAERHARDDGAAGACA